MRFNLLVSSKKRYRRGYYYIGVTQHNVWAVTSFGCKQSAVGKHGDASLRLFQGRVQLEVQSCGVKRVSEGPRRSAGENDVCRTFLGHAIALLGNA